MIGIAEWLENPEYWKGVGLYQKYGSSNFYKELFKSSKSNFTETKLFEELSKIICEGSLNGVIEEENIPKLHFNEYLVIQKKMTFQLKQIYRSIDNNMFQLDRATTDKTRKEYAFQILKLQAKKNSIYRDLNYLEENGSLLRPEIKKVFTTPEIQRLHVQISKAKKRLLQDPDKIRNRAKTENLIIEKEARLKQLIEERKVI